MEFILDIKQIIQVEKIKKEHRCQYDKNVGAIGGRFTYSFTPTAIGTIEKLICACGKEFDLTDYTDW